MQHLIAVNGKEETRGAALSKGVRERRKERCDALYWGVINGKREM